MVVEQVKDEEKSELEIIRWGSSIVEFIEANVVFGIDGSAHAGHAVVLLLHEAVAKHKHVV